MESQLLDTMFWMEVVGEEGEAEDRIMVVVLDGGMVRMGVIVALVVVDVLLMVGGGLVVYRAGGVDVGW